MGADDVCVYSNGVSLRSHPRVSEFEMHTILILSMLLLVGCTSSPPAPTYQHPEPGVLPKAAGANTAPEQCDWQTCVGEAQSTVEMMSSSRRDRRFE
jgi:uncharacterized protein YcfL